MSVPADVLDLLRDAELVVEGRMPWSSNATLLVELHLHGECRGRAIYKPLRGERPLWDFAPGLHRRELAAYLLSEALEMDLVPPTIVRDGPHGEGSVQWFVDADHSQHYFTLLEHRPDLHPRLAEIAVFDLIANNTDRKSGHVLIDTDDHVWGIDHGLCFAAEFKLRTVVWDFAGQQVDERIRTAVERLVERVPEGFRTLLDTDEIDAMIERAVWVIEHAELPADPTGRRYPWPLV